MSGQAEALLRSLMLDCVSESSKGVFGISEVWTRLALNQ